MLIIVLGALAAFSGGVTALALLFARFMRRNSERAEAALHERSSKEDGTGEDTQTEKDQIA